MTHRPTGTVRKSPLLAQIGRRIGEPRELARARVLNASGTALSSDYSIQAGGRNSPVAGRRASAPGQVLRRHRLGTELTPVAIAVVLALPSIGRS